LNAPPPRNDPKLFERIKVRIIKSFFVAGKVVEVGQRIELARHDALSMQAIGRVEIL